MLRWRLSIGSLLVAALIGLCWLDDRAARPGSLLAPLAMAVCVAASGELLRIFRALGASPSVAAVYLGPAITVAASCAPIFLPTAPPLSNAGRLGFVAAGLLASVLMLMVIEVRRFRLPGESAVNIGLDCLATLYVGGLISMLVQLRIMHIHHVAATMLPLGSMILLVKLSDTCQYFVGRAIGRRKLAPAVSPGKTWEGAIGGIGITVLVAAAAAPAIDFGKVQVPAAYGAIYALGVAVAGLCGDLCESLLKRDAQVKDSSAWLPGFGGVLDLVDSLLFAAPVAYLLLAWWQASG